MANKIIIKILENTSTTLKTACASQEIITALNHLIQLLKANKIDLPDNQSYAKGNNNKLNKNVHELSNLELAQLDMDSIGSMIKQPITKKYLERIAINRFNLSNGQLTRSSKSKIIELIHSAIENEKTHDAIGRLASGKSNDND